MWICLDVVSNRPGRHRLVSIERKIKRCANIYDNKNIYKIINQRNDIV